MRFLVVFAAILSGGVLQAGPAFYKDVSPILQRHCQSCHRPGEIGPMPLLTYAQARPWASAIREATALRKMPPWFADPRFGHFANDPSLTKAELDVISEWARTGAPEGDPAEAPAPVAWPETWRIGQPDAVVSMPKPFPIPASGAIEYQYIVIPTGFKEDRWVSAAEARPTDRSVVHHLVVYIREPGSSWLHDAKPGVPYVPPGDSLARRREGATTSDILLLYTPGSGPLHCRRGMAKKIPAGSDLVLQFHYTANGRETADQTRVGLVWAKEAPEKRILSLQMSNERFVIPPGDPDYQVSVQGTLPHDALLLSMLPHMHLRGKGFEFLAVEPGKQPEMLLLVKNFDFHWQLSYELAEPRLLKQGTLLRWTAHFDNSPGNRGNPDPEAEVRYGEQSWEEMMVGFFDVAVPADVDKQRFFTRQR